MSKLAQIVYHYFSELQYQLIMGPYIPPRGSIKTLCATFLLIVKDL